MKKVLVGVLAMMALMMLMGCGGNSEPAASAAAPAPAAPAADAAAAPAGTNAALNFTLVNATGYDIKELYLSPTTTKSWEENMITGGEALTNGASTPINFAGYKADVATWDLKAVDATGAEHVYEGLKLTEITKMTLNAENATIE